MTHEILQEDLNKCNLQISNVMSTVTKVRELLYRSASTASILEFQPHLIAYQLTLVESAIFLEIPSSAFLTHSPKTPHRSITASTDFFNYLTRMIEYSILFPPEASGRAQSMNHWIKVAVKLHELENFQTLKAVLCALGTPPIKRLKRTWSFLPRKSANKFETLSELMSEARNYGRYREMMNSLCAGTIVSSSSTNDAKEAARRPMVPFIGTFIMDMTYLLAAVKNSSFQGPSPSAQVSATSNDPRIQDLLLTLSVYQAGPKYSAQPPKAYIKASLKGQHHFRAPSLSSALQMTTKYRNSSNSDRDRQSFDDEDEELSGGSSGGQNSFGGGIRSTQQLILHYLLTRPWVPERMVDELSTIREPSKVNKNSPSSPSSSTTSSTTSSGISSSGWSSASSLYSQSTATSSSLSGMDLLRSRGSFEGSRPTSVEEE
ncbi:MAG: ras guanine nucleotide exchange factor domain-containing protein [Linnemannia elongata]|nr:MAG: ras guanine nucleotide exchange factor domain-containing protein [Linnemannia elongata]